MKLDPGIKMIGTLKWALHGIGLWRCVEFGFWSNGQTRWDMVADATYSEEERVCISL